MWVVQSLSASHPNGQANGNTTKYTLAHPFAIHSQHNTVKWQWSAGTVPRLPCGRQWHALHVDTPLHTHHITQVYSSLHELAFPNNWNPQTIKSFTKEETVCWVWKNIENNPATQTFHIPVQRRPTPQVPCMSPIQYHYTVALCTTYKDGTALSPAELNTCRKQCNMY